VMVQSKTKRSQMLSIDLRKSLEQESEGDEDEVKASSLLEVEGETEGKSETSGGKSETSEENKETEGEN
jgi:hypothetical protein